MRAVNDFIIGCWVLVHFWHRPVPNLITLRGGRMCDVCWCGATRRPGGPWVHRPRIKQEVALYQEDVTR